MTAIELDHAHDVVGYLKQQHQQIKLRMEQVMASTGSHREDSFTELRRLLAVHETAEEEVVHPRAQQVLDRGESVIQARLEEEHEAKKALAELETLDVSSVGFELKFRQFQSDVLAHAEAEENEEFDLLPDHFDRAQLERMQRAVQIAESIAPTRPHPG